MNFNLSKHTIDMLKERNIPEDWMWLTINSPDKQELGNDNNVHYFKSISNNEGRILHVIVNHNISPNKIVTVFFDRRRGGKNEVKSR